MGQNRFARTPARRGRILTELLLIILVPGLSLGIFGLCDPEIGRSLLLLPPVATSRVSEPVLDAVRLDDDQVLTMQLTGQLKLWSFPQAKQLGEMQSRITSASCVAFTAKKRLLVVGSKTGQLELWNIDHSGPPLETNDPDLQHINDCKFTPDGKTLITAGERGQLIWWDALTLTRRRTWESGKLSDSIRSLAISADGRTMLAGMFGGIVVVWDLETGKQLRAHQVSVPLEHANACVDSVAFLSNEREFIATTRHQGVSIRNVETGALVREFDGIFKSLKNGTLSPDGTCFVAATMAGEIITWNTATGKLAGPIKQLQTTVKCVLHSADGKTLLSGDWSGQVLFHRL